MAKVAPPDLIYVVVGVTGEYEDRTEWNVVAYFDADAAAEHAEKANKFAEHFCKFRVIQGLDLTLKPNPWDENMRMDYTGTSYRVDEVKLGYEVPQNELPVETKLCLECAREIEVRDGCFIEHSVLTEDGASHGRCSGSGAKLLKSSDPGTSPLAIDVETPPLDVHETFTREDQAAVLKVVTNTFGIRVPDPNRLLGPKELRELIGTSNPRLDSYVDELIEAKRAERKLKALHKSLEESDE